MIPGEYFFFAIYFLSFILQGHLHQLLLGEGKRLGTILHRLEVPGKDGWTRVLGQAMCQSWWRGTCLKFSSCGIGGARKIPISDAVSKENRVPDEIQNLGHEMIKKYIDARIKKIEEHNQRLFEAIQKETFSLREATRGSRVVVCPECNEEVPWGALMHHRTRTCKHCRV